MKLTLTLTEASDIITKALGLSATVEVSIQRSRNKAADLTFGPLFAMIGEINGLRYTSDQKIQAIRRFREVVAGGLGEAKWAIENWSFVKDWILKFRRIPIFEDVSSDPDGTNRRYGLR